MILGILLTGGLTTEGRAATKLEIKKGDHIALIGNTLADRMQLDGWLETLLIARFPEHDLTIRNLGFSGDELTLRLRSAAFGSPDEWLTKVEADVVLAFFGYNESFAGKEGLARFKAERSDGESFGDFCNRLGVDSLAIEASVV